MICVICGMRIEKEDGWLEKNLGISGYSVLYHESCFLSSHVAHLTPLAPDLGWACDKCKTFNKDGVSVCGFCDTPRLSG